jgi:precorrin-3B methylase
MEFLLQYFDEFDDLYGAAGLVWERLRRTLLRLFSIAMISAVAAAVAAAAIGLALLHPPIALATSTMLFVILLYRSVTVPSKKWASVA